MAETVREILAPRAHAQTPLVIEAGASATSLERVLRDVRPMLDTAGAVLLRGYDVSDAGALGGVNAMLGVRPMEYDERSTSRRRVEQHIYSTTEHPARLAILAHNENAYASSWPGLLLLCCARPSNMGGETPLYDSRAVLAAIEPELVDEMCRREVLHVRNFGTGLGLGLTEAYGTAERPLIEKRLRDAGAQFEWQAEGALRVTWRTRPVLVHPRTGAHCFFSHVAFFNQAALPEELREDMLAEYGPMGLPNNTFFGDGAPIPVAGIDAILTAYRSNECAFLWQKGDLLIIDNMLCAHGRRAFSGERRILVALCDPINRREVCFV